MVTRTWSNVLYLRPVRSRNLVEQSRRLEGLRVAIICTWARVAFFHDFIVLLEMTLAPSEFDHLTSGLNLASIDCVISRSRNPLFIHPHPRTLVELDGLRSSHKLQAVIPVPVRAGHVICWHRNSSFLNSSFRNKGRAKSSES